MKRRRTKKRRAVTGRVRSRPDKSFVHYAVHQAVEHFKRLRPA